MGLETLYPVTLCCHVEYFVYNSSFMDFFHIIEEINWFHDGLDGRVCREASFELEGCKFESGMVNKLLRFRYDRLFIALVWIEVGTNLSKSNIQVCCYWSKRSWVQTPSRCELFIISMVFAIHCLYWYTSKKPMNSWWKWWLNVWSHSFWTRRLWVRIRHGDRIFAHQECEHSLSWWVPTSIQTKAMKSQTYLKRKSSIAMQDSN